MRASALVLVLAIGGREPLAASLTAASPENLVQYGTTDRSCTVPSLMGLDRAAALSRLNESHLSAGRIESRPAAQAPGTVIDQRPQPGANLCEGSVDVVLSSGQRATETPADANRGGSRAGDLAVPIAIGVGVAAIAAIWKSRGDKPVKVPDLLAKTVPAADQALKKARLRMGEVAMRESAGASIGTVLEQSPVAGTLVPRNTVVTLAVSQGAPIADLSQQRADDTPPAVPATPVESRGTTPPPTSPNRTGGRGAAAVPPPSSPAPASTPDAVAPTVTPAPAIPNSIRVNPAIEPVTPVEPASWWRWVWLYLLLKIISLPALVFVWMRRRRARARSDDAPASEPPPAPAPWPWLTPRITFVPRPDAGHQSVTAIDARGGRTFELAYHLDPGTQHVRYQERTGAPS